MRHLLHVASIHTTRAKRMFICDLSISCLLFLFCFSYKTAYFILCRLSLCFFFFFSSRRRHTNSDRDWSSDVCSSDLDEPVRIGGVARADDQHQIALLGHLLDGRLAVGGGVADVVGAGSDDVGEPGDRKSVV